MVTTLAFVPVSAGETTAATCTPPALSGTTQLPGGYYISPLREEIWKEENGRAGLQIRAYTCSDGKVIPPDQCLALNPFTGALQQVLCTLAFASETLA